MNKVINDPDNKKRVAIVSVGYNRIKSQKRQLGSLLRADYSSYENVPLVISIDCSGDEELYSFVREFEWPYGDKFVLIREKRLGLKEHIFSCAGLTEYFKGVILLEDDIYVARDFYNYTIQMESVYGDCESVASIALYTGEMNGFCWLPYSKLRNEADVSAGQSICSWGEYWNERMWNDFRNWYDNNEINWDVLDMPNEIKSWDRAWSKFFYAYMLQKNKYSIYPCVSLTTNFSDAGEHGGANNTIVQVSLQQGLKHYSTLPFEKLVKYDVYSNNLCLADILGVSIQDICLDLYGVRPNDFNKRYYLTVKRLPYKVVKSFGLVMRPQELNVIEDIQGNSIFLYDTTQKDKKPRSEGLGYRLLYYLHGFGYGRSYIYLLLASWFQFRALFKKAWHKYVR